MNTIETSQISAPQIKRYSNVLTYLKDYYVFRKSEDASFTQDLWSTELGFKSTSTMYLISSGRRPLTLSFIDKLSFSLKLSNDEKNHLILLASYNKTKSPALKAILFDKILENLDIPESIVDTKNYFTFVSSPTIPLISLALAFDDIQGSEAELSQFLNISTKQVKQDLLALEKMGLVKKIQLESTDGILWKATAKNLVVPDDRSNNIMELFHQRTLLEADAILKQPDTFKRFRSILFAINPEDHELLLSEIEGFLTKIKNRFRQKDVTGKHIFKLNLNAYPATNVK